MKIKVINKRWGSNYLVLNWPYAHLPRTGEAIQLSRFISDDDHKLLQRSRPSEWGYADNEYENALDAIEDDYTSAIDFIRWCRDRSTGQVVYAVSLD